MHSLGAAWAFVGSVFPCPQLFEICWASGANFEKLLQQRMDPKTLQKTVRVASTPLGLEAGFFGRLPGNFHAPSLPENF